MTNFSEPVGRIKTKQFFTKDEKSAIIEIDNQYYEYNHETQLFTESSNEKICNTANYISIDIMYSTYEFNKMDSIKFDSVIMTGDNEKIRSHEAFHFQFIE